MSFQKYFDVKGKSLDQLYEQRDSIANLLKYKDFLLYKPRQEIEDDFRVITREINGRLNPT